MKTGIPARRSTRAIFLEAVDLADDAQRRSFLERACGNDPLLRDEIDRLLAMLASNASSPLDRAVEQFRLPEASDSQPGKGGPTHPSQLPKIDRYQLREQIGEGGMGIVYVAEQLEPIRRKVALKIIKPGMDSSEVINRFEAERQALALIDHPHVARVLDAGATEQGRPYFVMELIRGVPITEYCNEAKLDTRARLELFLKVCQGVQHAHLKGIIHRDLKPGNVLVTLHDGVPVPKVIDFGVAKALNQKLTDQTVYTQFRQMVGTPAYMSPEQAEMSGLDVDTRSDVYSLGVLLYELLTGATPFDKDELTSRGFDAMRRMICEQEPPRPSQRLSTLGPAARSTVKVRRAIDNRQFIQMLKRELDWIVMKALEKDRNRRYESASAMADDLQRYLADEPVEACPPATLYRLQKYARRHKALLTTTTLVAVTAVIGTAVSLRYARQSSLSADQARRLATQATAAQTVAEQHAAEAKRAILRSRTLLYAADMKLASDAIANEDIPRAAELLERHVPLPGEADLRGFEWRHFTKRVTPPHHFEISQGGWVDDMQLSPDGRWLAATAPAGTVVVYATSTWTQLRSLETGAKSVEAVAWAPDSKRIAAACDDGTLKSWDFITGRLQLTIKADAEYTPDLAFSPDGGFLYSCGDDRVARKWDARTGQALLEFVGHQRTVKQLAISPNGQLLATASSDGTAAIWNTETGERLVSHSLGSSANVVNCVSFSPDGRFVAAGSIYGEVNLLQTRSGKRTLLTRSVDGVEALTFFQEGALLAVADRGGAIQLLSVPRELEQPPSPSPAVLRWMAHDGRALSLAATSDGTRLISGGRDGVVRAWIPDLQAARWRLQPAQSPSGDIASSSANRVFTTGRAISLWDLGERRHCNDFIDVGRSGGDWRRIATSPDGRFLTAARHGLLVLFDVTAKRLVREWRLDSDADPNRELALSPDGRFIAFVDSVEKDFVSLYERDGFQPPELLPARQCRALAYSPDGRWFAVGVGTVNEVHVRDLNTGETIVLEGHSNTVGALAFAPGGDLLASIGDDRLLKVWRLPDGVLLFSIVAHRGLVETVAFSPDGRTIATAGSDRQVKLWHTATGQPLGALRPEKQKFKKLRFSQDGLRLVGLMQDSSIIVYDASPTSAATSDQPLATSN